MLTCLVLGFFLTFLLGITGFVLAKTAVQEIEACLVLLMSAMFFSAMAVINALDRMQAVLIERQKNDETLHGTTGEKRPNTA